MQDNLVGALGRNGVPDFLANIPTEAPTYAAAVAYEMWDFTTDVLDVGLNIAVDVVEFTFDLVGDVLGAIGDALSACGTGALVGNTGLASAALLSLICRV